MKQKQGLLIAYIITPGSSLVMILVIRELCLACCAPTPCASAEPTPPVAGGAASAGADLVQTSHLWLVGWLVLVRTWLRPPVLPQTCPL